MLKKHGWIAALFVAVAMVFVGCVDPEPGPGPSGLATNVIIKGIVDVSWTPASGAPKMQLQGFDTGTIECDIDETDRTFELEVPEGAIVSIPSWASSNTTNPWIGMGLDTEVISGGEGGDFDFIITDILFGEGEDQVSILEVFEVDTWTEVLEAGSASFGRYGNNAEVVLAGVANGIQVQRPKTGGHRNNISITIDLIALANLAAGEALPDPTISVSPNADVQIAQGGEQVFTATVENKSGAVVEWSLVGAPTGVTLTPTTGLTTTVSVDAAVEIAATFKVKASIQGLDPAVIAEVDVTVADASYVPPLWRMTAWLEDQTTIGWNTRPMRGTDGSGNVTKANGGVDVSIANAYDGADIFTVGTGALPLDLVNFEYEIVVTGNIIGTPSGRIQVGSRLDNSWANPFASSETLSGNNAPFTVTATITRANIPPVVEQGIRIRNETGTANFHIAEITVSQKGPAALSASVAAAEEALALVTYNNATTDTAIMSAVQAVIGDDVSAAWTALFAKTEATSATAGSITGTITLTLGADTANLVINKVIPILVTGTIFDMQDFATQQEVEDHFEGVNNRGTITVSGSTGSWVVAVGDFDGENLSNSQDYGWRPITLLRANQAAAGDVLKITLTLSSDATLPYTDGTFRLQSGTEVVYDIADTSNNITTLTHNIEVTLTTAQIPNDIVIAWNYWGGTFGSTGVKDNNLVITVTALTLERN